MANTILSLNLSDAVHELASTGPELESALESFERQLKSDKDCRLGTKTGHDFELACKLSYNSALLPGNSPHVLPCGPSPLT